VHPSNILFLAVVLAAPLEAQGRDCDGYLTPLAVPDGFCVREFARGLGPVRHLVALPSGVVVAATLNAPGLLRLGDRDRDGVADSVVRFGPGMGGTGVAWAGGWLYFAADSALYRVAWPATATQPAGAFQRISGELPVGKYGSAHTMKGVTVDREGAVYVSIGSETDNCQVHDREPKSPGRWPCQELETRAGVWRFLPPARGGEPWTSERFATGLRNAEALATDPNTNRIWSLTQGRDFLNRTWGWSDEESAEQPAEMLEQLVQGGDYGWPYCHGYWERDRTILVRSPEYAARSDVDCSLKIAPVLGFPGHWAPVDVTVSEGALPSPWRSGMFIAFHGSRSRAPLPEAGHQVMFVPMDESGRPAGDVRIFLRTIGATGSLRPAGVAVAPGGMVYVSDDEHGTIFRIEPHPPKNP
jgi:glucose/arabinose dehydrogenase